jgi:hypothetical protein
MQSRRGLPALITRLELAARVETFAFVEGTRDRDFYGHQLAKVGKRPTIYTSDDIDVPPQPMRCGGNKGRIIKISEELEAAQNSGRRLAKYVCIVDADLEKVSPLGGTPALLLRTDHVELEQYSPSLADLTGTVSYLAGTFLDANFLPSLRRVAEEIFLVRAWCESNAPSAPLPDALNSIAVVSGLPVLDRTHYEGNLIRLNGLASPAGSIIAWCDANRASLSADDRNRFKTRDYLELVPRLIRRVYNRTVTEADLRVAVRAGLVAVEFPATPLGQAIVNLI